MATLTTALTLTGTAADFGAALSLSQSNAFTFTHTNGIAKKKLTSTSKTCQIFINDGDGDVADVTTREGKYIDITDNHGLNRRYVFTTADSGGAATGTILASGTDIGSGDITTRLHLVGGIAVQITDGDEERDILEQLKDAINHANGHAGSIVATAVAAEANGPQSTTLTNRDSSTPPFVDNKNATWQDLHSTTNSLADHVVLIKKGEYASPSMCYIRNTAAFGDGTANCIYAYYDGGGSDTGSHYKIQGGQFAIFPSESQETLYAYTSTSGTVVEFMVLGTEA